MRRLDVWAMAFLACLSASGCGGHPPDSLQQYKTLQIAPMMASVRTGATAGISGAGNRFVAVAKRTDDSGNYSWDLSSPAASVNWSSSNPNIVSIDSLGRFTALSPGATTISATLDTLSASTTLTVSDVAPMLTAVEMYPGLPKIGDNGTITGIQFQAIAKYDDGSQKDVTAQGVWLSMDVSAATVDATGMVTYKSAADCTLLFLYGLSYNRFTLKHLSG